MFLAFFSPPSQSHKTLVAIIAQNSGEFTQEIFLLFMNEIIQIGTWNGEALNENEKMKTDQKKLKCSNFSNITEKAKLIK